MARRGRGVLLSVTLSQHTEASRAVRGVNERAYVEYKGGARVERWSSIEARHEDCRNLGNSWLHWPQDSAYQMVLIRLFFAASSPIHLLRSHHLGLCSLVFPSLPLSRRSRHRFWMCSFSGENQHLISQSLYHFRPNRLVFAARAQFAWFSDAGSV